jgi:hypothetical protein
LNPIMPEARSQFSVTQLAFLSYEAAIQVHLERHIGVCLLHGRSGPRTAHGEAMSFLSRCWFLVARPGRAGFGSRRRHHG